MWKEGEIFENTESVAEKACDGDPAPSAQRVARLERSREAPLDHCFNYFGCVRKEGWWGNYSPVPLLLLPVAHILLFTEAFVRCHHGDLLRTVGRGGCFVGGVTAILVTEEVPQARLHSRLRWF